MKKTRIAAFLFAVCLGATAMTACGDSKDNKKTKTSSKSAEDIDEKDLEEALVNKKSFHDLDDWDIHEIFEEGVYEGTRVYIYDEGGEDEPFCADEVEVGTVDIKGPLVSLCTEVCC